MNNDDSLRIRHRFTFQCIAFAMIILPPIGLFQSTTGGNPVLTMVLMGVITIGMALAIWVN